jgi:uncharacterized protein (TIGR04255 family)
MAAHKSIKISPSERFEHLPSAPIVEAVIQLVGRAEAQRGPTELKASLSNALPEYSNVKELRAVSVSLPLGTARNGEPGQSDESAKPKRAWPGFRLATDDGRYVAMFTRDYFSLSRLRPYEDWETFQSEAMRLWDFHMGLAGPTEIGRIGVRFINRFDVPAVDLDPGEYIRGLGNPPGDLPRSEFLHRDGLSVPGHPSYGVTVIRTVKPADPGQADHVALLLDIDVFSSLRFPPDPHTIKSRLADMHWLKNRVFFDNVTERALDLCR